MQRTREEDNGHCLAKAVELQAAGPNSVQDGGIVYNFDRDALGPCPQLQVGVRGGAAKQRQCKVIARAGTAVHAAYSTADCPAGAARLLTQRGRQPPGMTHPALPHPLRSRRLSGKIDMQVSSRMLVDPG